MPSFRVAKPRVRVGLDDYYTYDGNIHTQDWNLILDSEGEDMWDAGAPADVVIPRTGLYLVTAHALLDGYGTGTVVWMHVNVNGAQYTSTNREGDVVTTALENFAVLQLVAGDVVTLSLERQPSAQNYDLYPGERTTLAVTRIGPERWT